MLLEERLEQGYRGWMGRRARRRWLVAAYFLFMACGIVAQLRAGALERDVLANSTWELRAMGFFLVGMFLSILLPDTLLRLSGASGSWSAPLFAIEGRVYRGAFRLLAGGLVVLLVLDIFLLGRIFGLGRISALSEHHTHIPLLILLSSLSRAVRAWIYPDKD